MAHNIVCKIEEKSWTPGIKDKTKANYHVAMSRFKQQITWVPGKKPKFEFFNDGKYDGVTIVVE
tara:strand:- start:685 stop:876 length:192 start_codon:yes stop_codon:yes gene_type:complete